MVHPVAVLESTLAPTAETTSSVVLHPVTEAAHLRNLIEKQPACVMRVSLNGGLLAVNDAALALLGAGSLDEVLNTNLCDRLRISEPGGWNTFVARATASEVASQDCDLLNASGDTRPVMLQARALVNHPDGIASLLVIARDMTRPRQLEAALRREAQERATQLDALAAQHQQALAAREREALGALASLRDQADAVLGEKQAIERRLQATEEERRTLRADLERTRGERDLIQASLEESEQARRQLQDALDRHAAARAALELSLRTREARWQQMAADQAASRVDAERALVEARARIDQLQQALTAVFDAAATARRAIDGGQQ